MTPEFVEVNVLGVPGSRLDVVSTRFTVPVEVTDTRTRRPGTRDDR